MTTMLYSSNKIIMRKKKALIVGGSGPIGLYLSKYLLKKNYLVYVTTRKIKKKQ